MTISKPDVSLTLGKATRVLGLEPHKVLLVGRYTSNTYIKDAILEDLDNSHLKNMAKFYKKIAPKSKLYLLGVDGASVKVSATSTITVSAGVAEDTVLKIELLDEVYTLDIPAQTTQNDIVTQIETILTGSQYIDNIVSALGVLTITTSLVGKLGNNIYFNVSGSEVITFTQFTGGSGTDTVDFTAIGDDRYQTICLSSEFDATPLSNLLKNRMNTPNQVLEGVGIYAIQNSNVNSTDFNDSFNNMWISKLGVNTVNNHKDMVAVALGAVRYVRFTENEDASQFVENSAGLANKIGGVGLACIPYHNTNMSKYLTVKKDFTLAEVGVLEGKRVGVLGLDTSGFNTKFGSVFTTEVVDTLGNLDTTYRYLNNADVAITVKEYFFTNLKQDFSQSTMVNNNAIAERGQRTPTDVKAKINGYYKRLVEFGIVTEFEAFKENAVVAFDKVNGLIKINYLFYPVQGVRGIIGNLDIKIGD